MTDNTNKIFCIPKKKQDAHQNLNKLKRKRIKMAGWPLGFMSAHKNIRIVATYSKQRKTNEIKIVFTFFLPKRDS